MTSHCDNCDQRDICGYSMAVRRRPGRPRKEHRIEPPTLKQYTSGHYRLRRKRSLLVPLELDKPQEYSGFYRNWVREVMK